MNIKKITRKKKDPAVKTSQELLTDAFIKSGGKTTQESESYNSDENALDSRFTLRISSKIIQKIDGQRKKRVGVFSRNSWILEAIEEKLKSK